jgi:hypothetical protein
MFVVSINSIKKDVKPLKFGGSSSLIPEYFASLVVDGNRSIDAKISIETDMPEQSGTTTWSGDDSDMISDWSIGQYGMYGHYIGENPTPISLVHALTVAIWLEWEIIEGKEILDIPLEELPPSAIS